MLEPELCNPVLIEAEVVGDLVAHCLDDVLSETFRVISEVTDEGVAEDQDLVWDPAASEDRSPSRPVAEVKPVGMVLLSTIGNHDRHVLERLLKFGRQIVQRRSDKRFEFFLAVVPVVAHGGIVRARSARPRGRSRELAKEHTSAARGCLLGGFDAMTR